MVRGFFDKTMLVLSKGKSPIEYECHYSVQVKFFGTVNRLLTRSPVFFFTIIIDQRCILFPQYCVIHHIQFYIDKTKHIKMIWI